MLLQKQKVGSGWTIQTESAKQVVTSRPNHKSVHTFSTKPTSVTNQKQQQKVAVIKTATCSLQKRNLKMKTMKHKTAKQFADQCRAVAKHENRWSADDCTRCFTHNINKDGDCNDCLDDAHEAWIMTREWNN